MNAPIPPSGQTPSIPAATLAAAARGVIVNAPGALSLSAGQVLEGRVLSQSNGQLLLQSPHGPVTIKTAASPPVDAIVLVRIRTGGTRPQVQLLPQGGSGATTAQTVQPQPAVVRPAFSPGSVIHATVGGREPATPAAGAAPSANAAAPTSAQTGPARLDAGTTLALRVLGVSPPGSAAPAAPLNAAAQPLAATVTAQSAGGAVIAQTEGATLSFANAPSLPPGTRLALELLDRQSPIEGRTTAEALDRWSVLREIVGALRQADPGLARTVVDTMVATAGPKLAPAMLFVLSAVLSGDVRRFLGDEAVRMLMRRPGAVLERLSADLMQAQRVVSDSAGQDWRSLLLPILTDDGVEELHFLVRRPDEDDASEQDAPGVRFMIDVTLSRLGPFRFDGFARDKTLNLIVRTHRPLPAAMQDDIQALYVDTLSALGYAGALSFRVTPQFDPMPADRPAEAGREWTV